MIFTFKFGMAALSVGIATIAYAIMLWGIFRQNKHPSPVSWFGFGFCTAVGFLVQVYGGADMGSLVMGWTAFCCFVVAFTSWKTGGIEFTRLDQITFWLGVDAFVGWLVCYRGHFDQTLAAIFATASDLFLYGPSIRNGWRKPEKENPSGYALNSVKFVPSLFAMGAYSFATVLYPVALILANAGMNTFLLARGEWLMERCRDARMTRSRFHDAVVPIVVGLAVAGCYSLRVHFELVPEWGYALMLLAASTAPFYLSIGTMMNPISNDYPLDNSDEFRRWCNGMYLNAITTFGVLAAYGFQTGVATSTAFYTEGFKEPISDIISMLGIFFSMFLITIVYPLVVVMAKAPFNFLKWLPQKLLLPLAFSFGAYADRHWGLAYGGLVFFGLLWTQFVWTVSTWPCEKIELNASLDEGPISYGGCAH